jgi:hypothetical protein
MRDREKSGEEWRPPEERGGEPRPVQSNRPALKFPRLPLGSWRIWRRILLVLAIIFIPLAAIGGFKLYEAYAEYAAIVDGRLVQEAQRRRAGVYAAPRRVSVGQQISQDELRDRLLRAGYRQSRPDDPTDLPLSLALSLASLGAPAALAAPAAPAELEAGAFIIDGNVAQFRLNEFDRDSNAPESVNINFNRKTGGRIVQIENAATGENLQQVDLPPEPLTQEIGATTLPRGVGIQVRSRTSRHC